MNLKYTFGLLLSIPLLPLMYWQGKRIRASVPQLPEAEGPQGQSPFPQGEQSPLKLLTLGESTIAGVGVKSHAEGFTGTLAKELAKHYQRSIDWRVYARSGYTAQKVTTKIVPKIEEEQADLIVIGLGGNDAFTLNRPSQWKRDVEDLIKALQSKFPEATLVFINMPPIKLFPAFTFLIKFTIGNLVEILGEELQDLVKGQEKVHYFGEKITLETWIERYQVKESPDAFFSDGVHPSKLTYQTWARDVAGNVVGELGY